MVESQGTRIDRPASHRVFVDAVRAFSSLVKLAKKAEQLNARDDVVGLSKAVAELLHGIAGISEIADSLRSIGREVAGREDQALLELEARVRDACAERGWHVDGAWPSLYIARAIPVTIDPLKRTTMMGRRRLTSVSVTEIVNALEPIVKQLLPSDFNAGKFLVELAAAYDFVALKASVQAPIFDVYRALVVLGQGSRFWRDARAADFAELSAEQFRARMSRTLEAGAITTPEGRTLRLLPPLNAADGFYLYQPAEARFGFIGRVEFISTRENV